MRIPKVGSQVRMYGGAEYKVLLVGRLHGKRAVAVKWEDNAPHWIYLSQLPTGDSHEGCKPVSHPIG